jgi:hypothetical protein
MHAMWDAGCRLPAQTADGRARCFCGAEIGIGDLNQHIPRRAHEAQDRLKFVADHAALGGDRETNFSKRLGQIDATLSDPLFVSVAAERRRQLTSAVVVADADIDAR